jgi:hypothetical protein
MKSLHKVLIAFSLMLVSLPAICQHYYDSAGHLLITQKGYVYYDSTGKEIGRIGYGFEDPSGVSVITRYGNKLFFSESYKYNPNVEYTSVYMKGRDIYSFGKMIGYIDTYKVYDLSDHELGYFDINASEYEAMMFYFLLLPNWGGRVP